jgi:hypothetical protein
MDMKKTSTRNRLIYAIIYFFGLLGGLVAYFFGKGRTKMHGKQAIVLGLLEVIVAIGLSSMMSIYYVILLLGIILGLMNVIFI